MTRLLGGQIGLDDFIFVHRKGELRLCRESTFSFLFKMNWKELAVLRDEMVITNTVKTRSVLFARSRQARRYEPRL